MYFTSKHNMCPNGMILLTDCGVQTSSTARTNALYQSFRCFLIGVKKHRNGRKEASEREKGSVGTEGRRRRSGGKKASERR